jgi:RNA polymerase sigma factor (sigma-70 family)
LRNAHDADDAFQATFLVLARKAASVRPREMVGNWLHGVAHMTAIRAKAVAAKQRARETQVSAMPEPMPRDEDLSPELLALLDKELKSLPDRLRAAIVLCDLEGRTRREVARQLKIPEGTLSSRLTTGRRMLAKKLARHGVFSAAALATILSQNAGSACVSASLVGSTVQAATLIAAGQAITSPIASAKVVLLSAGVMKSMLLSKLKSVLAVVLVAVAALTGIASTGSCWFLPEFTLPMRRQPGVTLPVRRLLELILPVRRLPCLMIGQSLPPSTATRSPLTRNLALITAAF